MTEGRSVGRVRAVSYPPAQAGRAGSTLLGLLLVGAAGLALGVLTAYAQAWLPEDLGSLANSSGTWALIAFALALAAAGPRIAALFGCVALLALLAGYVLGASVRGFASGTSLVVFWGGAALVVGPVLGIGAHWVRTGRGAAAATGIGAMSGVLAGEGLYGLGYIADTTYPPFWWGETILAAGLLTAAVAFRLEGSRARLVALAVAALTALAFVAIYSRDLISILP